ncbi:MAG: alpha/beta hydrolase [bacterium]|nr:alpha/beta hydrolase [bacterium]
MTSLQEWRQKGGMHDWHDYRIFVIDSAQHDAAAAQKPVLVLIHGYPTSSWDFSPMWADLCRTFRVVAMDMLGFGFSSKPHRHHYHIAEQADLVEFVLASAGVTQCHLFAHDYGDTVAQELLARDLDHTPSRYLSVALLNGGLFPETHRARPIQRWMAGPLGPVLALFASRGRLLSSFSAVFGEHTKPDAPTLEAVWQLISEHDGLRVLGPLLTYIAERRQHRARWVQALTSARMPLALINGSADPVSGAHMVARFREVVGTQHFIRELPGIGHYPQLEAIADVLAAYQVFTQGCGVTG